MIKFKLAIRKLIAFFVASSVSFAAGAQTITYYHNDISGTPLVATDAAGNLLWKENYRPYGEKLNNQAASIANKIGFHGKPFDNNSGLSYTGARYYDPVVGRFLGIDAVDFQQDNIHSFNRYAFANNNPYKYVDPDGQFSLGALLVATAAVLLVGSAIQAQKNANSTQSTQSFASAVKQLAKDVSSAVGKALGSQKESTLSPGPHAGDSIPARGPGRDFTPEERGKINDIGKNTGCHTCGSKDPGTKSGNFVPDHQPPNGTNEDGAPQRLYPHCLQCSRIQGGEVRSSGGNGQGNGQQGDGGQGNGGQGNGEKGTER